MMRGWWEQQCQDSSFQEVKSVSSWFPRGCSTWELQLHKAEEGPSWRSPWHLTGRPWERERVHRDGKKKDTPSIISSAQYKGHLPLSKEISWGYRGKHEDGWSSERAWQGERNGKTGKDKRLSFPLLKRSNVTYRGHERDDEIGRQKEMWRHAETKGKQTELMWLLVPICKVFNSPENFPATPTFTFSPLPRLSSDTLIMLHTFTFEVALHAESFFVSTARGPSQATRTWRMGPGRGVWEGGLIYIQDHTDTDACTSSKAKIEEKSPQKAIRRTGRGGKRHSPLILADVGHLLHICASICRNVEIKHKHTPSSSVWVGCVGVGHGGEILTLQAQVAL